MSESSIDVSQWWHRKTETLRTARSVQVGLFVRSLAPSFGVRRRQERTYERLRDLERDGVVDEISVSIWGKATCTDGPLTETAACRRVRSQVERFRNWATNSDAPVETPFSERDVRSETLDQSYRTLVLPELCLSLRADDDLAIVLPCQVDGHDFTIDDLFTALDGIGPEEGEPVAERG